MIPSPAHLDLVQASIDLELTHLWTDIGRVCDNDLILVNRIARAAWWAGYYHACVEAEPGLFARAHGYRMPPRRAA
jgi:hypothetical protein